MLVHKRTANELLLPRRYLLIPMRSKQRTQGRSKLFSLDRSCSIARTITTLNYVIMYTGRTSIFDRRTRRVFTAESSLKVHRSLSVRAHCRTTKARAFFPLKRISDYLFPFLGKQRGGTAMFDIPCRFVCKF